MGRIRWVNVSLAVRTSPGQLITGSDSLTFTTSAASPAATSQTLSLSNGGGTALGIGALSCASAWCGVTGVPAQIGPGGSVTLTITANPAGLAPGYYWTTLSIVTSGGRATVPVTLAIASAPGILLAPSGYAASVQVAGVLSGPPASFQVIVPSAASVNWTAAIQQGSFLRLANTSGSSSASQPGTVNFSIDPTAAASLAVGTYYGLIGVSASGVANSPQGFVVVLNITPASEKAKPSPAPAGLVFLTSASGSPPPQNVTLYTSSIAPQPWQASTDPAGATWLSVSPGTGTTLAAAPSVTSIKVDAAKLVPGVYRATVNYAFAAVGIRSVNVTLVVLAAEISSASEAPQPRAACSPAQVVPTSTGLVNNFSSPTAWPTPLEMTVVDNCGTVVTAANIVATFSNGDPPLALALANPQTGRYSATWTPRRTNSQILIRAQAAVSGLPTATIQLVGAVIPSGAPAVNRGAVLNLYNPTGGAPAAPGTLLQIRGEYLAAQALSSQANPLPKALSGTAVLIGGIAAPVASVSPGQVNVQAPFELTPGQPYQLIVSANGALTTPENVQISDVSPGLGLGVGGFVTATRQKEGTAVTQAAPARPGEAISVYLTGMGLGDINVESGAGGPLEPASNVILPPAVTLDSIPAVLSFAGLAPGQPGIYRIDLKVPDKAPSGELTLQVTQGGASSNAGLLPVQK